MQNNQEVAEISTPRKIMNTLFILHPWGFVIFLLLGVGGFLYTTSRIQIPVYTTVEAAVERENGIMRLDLQQKEFEVGTPVFLYESRDDHLEKVTDYEVEEGWLLTESIDNLPDTGKLYLDIQTDEISLLRHIFIKGGSD